MKTSPTADAWLKVPAVTLSFWVIKILSTTVGETGADHLAVHAGLGTTLTGAATLVVLVGTLTAQLRASRYIPWLYWLNVVLISVAGTQVTDALTDRLGVPLWVSTVAFAAGLAVLLALWHRAEGTLSIRSVGPGRRERFYWAAILLTFALGTAAGDFATEALGLGFQVGVVVFAGLIGLVIVAWRLGLDAVAAFWGVYILTRPLGAALGDLLSQSRSYGGLGLGTSVTSLVFLTVIAALVWMLGREHSPPMLMRR